MENNEERSLFFRHIGKMRTMLGYRHSFLAVILLTALLELGALLWRNGPYHVPASSSALASSSSSHRRDKETDHHEDNLLLRSTLNNETMVGSWVGNLWIPTEPWQLFTISQLQSIFHGRRILWIGDTTARRSSLFLNALLNHATTTTTTPTNYATTEDISVAHLEQHVNDHHPVTQDCPQWSQYPAVSLCRSIPNHKNKGVDNQNHADTEIVWYQANCLQTVHDLLQTEQTRLARSTNKQKRGRPDAQPNTPSLPFPLWIGPVPLLPDPVANIGLGEITKAIMAGRLVMS